MKTKSDMWWDASAAIFPTVFVDWRVELKISLSAGAEKEVEYFDIDGEECIEMFDFI